MQPIAIEAAEHRASARGAQVEGEQIKRLRHPWREARPSAGGSLPGPGVFAHLPVLDERLIDGLGCQDNLASFLQAGDPLERLVQRLADGEAAVPAKHGDLVLYGSRRGLL